MAAIDWNSYINQYHDGHAGITETALVHSAHPEHGTPYQWLAAALPADAGDVVDLACGSCPIQPHLHYGTYLGVDRNEAELAAAYASGRGPVLAGDITELDLPEASVDTVVMSMALMLVPIDRTLSEVHRVLRPGGVFAAMVPALWPIIVRDLPATVALSAALRGPGSMPQTLSARALRKHLRSADLVPVTITQQRFPFPLDTAADATLAVDSLYTPSRTGEQLQRARRWLTHLTRLPVRMELPVPLLRVTARRPLDA